MSTFLIKQRNRLFELRMPRSLKIVYVWGKGLGVFANRSFKKGDKIISLKGEIVDAEGSTPEAVQIDERLFIDSRYLRPEDFINHSCSPNARLDLTVRWFFALKNISKNEEITFNYHTTEWDMEKYDAGFSCNCGSKNCLRAIRGFRYLTRAQKLKLRPYLSPFLTRKLSR